MMNSYECQQVNYSKRIFGKQVVDSKCNSGYYFNVEVKDQGHKLRQYMCGYFLMEGHTNFKLGRPTNIDYST